MPLDVCLRQHENNRVKKCRRYVENSPGGPPGEVRIYLDSRSIELLSLDIRARSVYQNGTVGVKGLNEDRCILARQRHKMRISFVLKNLPAKSTAPAEARSVCDSLMV